MLPSVARSDADLIKGINRGRHELIEIFQKRHTAFLHDIYWGLDPSAESKAPSDRSATLIHAMPTLVVSCNPKEDWEAHVFTAAIVRLTKPDDRSDTELVCRIAAGDTDAILSFKARHATLLLNICKGLTVDDDAKREAFRELILEEDWPRLFAGFTGKSSWNTFVKAAVMNRFLFPRLKQRIINDEETHASADFEAFFRHSMSRIVQKLTDDKILADDICQSVFQSFLLEDCQRLRKFAQEAQHKGYVLRNIEDLAYNLATKYGPRDKRKRTLPKLMKTLSPFEQDVFKQFYWKHAKSTASALAELRPRYRNATETSIVDARIRIEKIGRSKGGIFVVDGETEEFHDELIADEPQTSSQSDALVIREVVLLVAQTFKERKNQPDYLKPETKVRYVRERLKGQSAAEIARILDLTDTQVYALARSVLSTLHNAPTVQTLYAWLYKDSEYEPVRPW